MLFLINNKKIFKEVLMYMKKQKLKIKNIIK